MGLFQTISTWKAQRYEKYKADMESLGKCPDCSGRGFPSTYSHVYPVFMPLYTMPADCLGCNGSGLYADWVETSQEHF